VCYDTQEIGVVFNDEDLLLDNRHDIASNIELPRHASCFGRTRRGMGTQASRSPPLDAKTLRGMITTMSGHSLGRILILIGCSTALTCAACSRPTPTPEDEIRQLVAVLEDAVREKDITTIKAHISERYRDEEQRDKQALKAVLAYYFLQHRSIHLLTRMESLRFPRPGTAEITVFAAMAGTQIPDASWLPRIQADVYRFDAAWEKETGGVWRLREASWHPATTEDFG
jgi:hypothetical protein